MFLDCPTKEKFVVNAIRQLVLDGQGSSYEMVNFLVNASSMEKAKELITQYIRNNVIFTRHKMPSRFFV